MFCIIFNQDHLIESYFLIKTFVMTFKFLNANSFESSYYQKVSSKSLTGRIFVFLLKIVIDTKW